MLRACTVCGVLSRDPRCPEHEGRQRNGSTRAWRKVRAEVLKRDHHRCFYCGGPANTVDHIKPVAAEGGTDDKDNLVAACSLCNGSKGDRAADSF